ncbi:MAG: prolipoprotein diacylglyceryl transferase [Kineosporiaceae bacterium]
MTPSPMPWPADGGIPYRSFPAVDLGPFDVQVYGVMVALGVLLGGWLMSVRNRRYGIAAERSQNLVVVLVAAGLVGARLAWVLPNLDQIESPVDVVAVWDGGLTLSGGFLAALIAIPLATRGMTPSDRWRLLDGAALGMAVGLVLGRIGCIAVGEHFGRETTAALGLRYLGGSTVQGPLEVGTTYWSLPVVEIGYLLAILAVMLVADRRRAAGPGTLVGIFVVGYGLSRFVSDFLRAYDITVLGLTGAQYLMLAAIPFGVWALVAARHRASHLTPGIRDPADAAPPTVGDAPVR